MAEVGVSSSRSLAEPSDAPRSNEERKENAMAAEAQRETIHKVAHVLLDGLRILRERGEPYYDAETIRMLDEAIAELMPMEGFPIQPEARIYALAHGLRVYVEEAIPFLEGGPVDPSNFPTMLHRVEDALLVARNQKLNLDGLPDNRT